MAFGYSIENQAGQSLIQENYSNLAMIEKGTVTINDLFEGVQPYTIAFTRSGLVNPVMVVRPVSEVRKVAGGDLWSPDYNGFRDRSPSGAVGVDTKFFNGVWTFRFWSATVNTQCEWYLFDSAAPVPSSDYGLSIYKPDGNVAWNSSWKVMRIVSLHPLPRLLQDSSTYDMYVPGPTDILVPNLSRTYAVAATPSRLFIEYGDRYGDYISRTADGFQVMTGGRKWPSIVYDYADVMAANGGTMTFLVDVTGY